MEALLVVVFLFRQYYLPVVIAGHLFYDLAVDLISEYFILCRWAKDLICELQGWLDLSGGVVTHVFQNRCIPFQSRKHYCSGTGRTG